MPLAVVGYPELAATDRQWIEATRAAHDPRAGGIRAHVTLVFPVELEGLDAHVASVLRAQATISFVLREVRAVPDGHVFLVPDEGAAAITALHDRLYEGPLAPHLRADLPFVPHITVAAGGDVAQVTARLRRELRPIRGELRELELVEVRDGLVRTVARHALT